MPQLKRIIVSFDPSLVSPAIRDKNSLMLEFMKSIEAYGLGYESKEGQPVSWSSETLLNKEQMQDRLQEWWNKRDPQACVTFDGKKKFRTSTTDIAFHFTIKP